MGEGKYKCTVCGAESNKIEEHCGKHMEKVCDCGSGKYDEECCAPEGK